jgi:hypothetical protein
MKTKLIKILKHNNKNFEEYILKEEISPKKSTCHKCKQTIKENTNRITEEKSNYILKFYYKRFYHLNCSFSKKNKNKMKFITNLILNKTLRTK